MLVIDEKIRHWIADVLRLPQDDIVEKTILGPTSRATNMKIWTTSNSRIS